MGYTLDSQGLPVFTATPTQTTADLQAAADAARKVGGVLRGTSTDRGLLTSDAVGLGWLFVETDTKRVYEWTSSGWQYLAGGNRITAYRSSSQIAGVGALITMTGVATGTTTAGGVLVHSFPVPFPAACVGVILMPDHQSGFSGTNLPYLVNGSLTPAGFQSFWTGVATQSVTCAYMALGY